MTPYDEVPYEGAAQRFVNPDRLATMAILHGLDPAPPDDCRVLEIGCASGETLIPLAETRPRSEFVGIDYARVQVEAAKRDIGAIGLTNIRIEQGDVSDESLSPGRFDYVLVHGLYSWVPAGTREALLRLIERSLSPRGIAYISFEAMPGALFKRYVADMMRFHVRGTAEPDERVSRARQIAAAVEASLAPGSGPLKALLEAYAPELQERAGTAILHDELGPETHAFYFAEFNAALEAHGLQYLSDAEYSTGAAGRFPPALQAMMRQDARSLADVEQYMDFFSCRYFRRALVCPAAARVQRGDPPSARSFERMRLSSPAWQVEGDADPAAEGRAKFARGSGESLTTSHPVTKAAMAFLGEAFPASIPFPELVARALDSCGLGPGDEEKHGDVYAASVMASLSQSGELISLSVAPDPFVAAVSDRPRALAYARLCAARGAYSVANASLDMVDLDEMLRALLLLADGSRDSGALLRDLAAEARSHPGWPEPSAADVEAALESFAVDRLLAG